MIYGDLNKIKNIKYKNIKDFIKEVQKRNISICYLNIKEDETLEIYSRHGYLYLDELGSVENAEGYYEQFLDISSSVTKLEQTLMLDIREILDGKYEILILGANI